MKESYNFKAIARRITSVLNEEGVPIAVIPDIFKMVEDDIRQNTVPYNPSCSQMNDFPTSDTISRATEPKG